VLSQHTTHINSPLFPAAAQKHHSGGYLSDLKNSGRVDEGFMIRVRICVREMACPSISSQVLCVEGIKVGILNCSREILVQYRQ
jgi:hypothetical protein